MTATCIANHVDGYGRSLISLPCSVQRGEGKEETSVKTQTIPRTRLKPNKADINSANHKNAISCPTNQAVSHWLLNTEYRVQSHDNSCEIRSKEPLKALCL